MPLATQTKLLRVLDQREFMRVGGEDSIRVDVRVVAATNQSLRQLVALREFRKDLYYRLNVLSIELPPLRERRADIPLLVKGFVREVTRRNDLEFPGISDEAMAILEAHRWPGNVRELRNLVESMVVLAPGRAIQPADIPDEVRREGSDPDLLPAPIPRAASREGSASESLRPELEFIFRTLVDLRVDLDDLKKDFDFYRERSLPSEAESGRSEPSSPRPSRELPAPGGIELGGWTGGSASGTPASWEGARIVDVDDEQEDDGVVVYRDGMTMEEMEREAIRVVLGQVGGNRRMAAERLGIGERTLYRKIKQFGLEL